MPAENDETSTQVQLADAGFDIQTDVLSDDSGCNNTRPMFIVSEPTRLSELFGDAGSESSCSSSEDETDNLSTCLERWYHDAKANLNQLGLLLNELRPFHPELPRDPRTIVETPRFSVVNHLDNGTYVHVVGLEKGLLSRLKTVRCSCCN